MTTILESKKESSIPSDLGMLSRRMLDDDFLYASELDPQLRSVLLDQNWVIEDSIVQLASGVDVRLSSIHEPIADHEKRIADLESKFTTIIKEKDTKIAKLENEIQKMNQDRCVKWFMRAIEDSKIEQVL